MEDQHALHELVQVQANSQPLLPIGILQQCLTETALR